MVSVSQSIHAAYHQMERILFRPFDIQRWFALGFTAFLASLGGGFQFRFNGLPKEWSGLGDWLHNHMGLAIALGILLLIALLAVLVVLNWLACRGQFMFLDNVVHNRTEIHAPWARFRQPANQLLVFQLLLGVGLAITLLLLVGIGVGGVFLLRAAFEQLAAPWKLGVIAVLACLALAFFLGLLLFSLVLQDFVAPLMYRMGLTPANALRYFLNELLPDHGWDFSRFYLLKLVIALGGLVAILCAGCLTCCIGFLPYLSSVLTLPLSVFFLCLNLDFLAQLQPSLALLPPENLPLQES